MEHAETNCCKHVSSTNAETNIVLAVIEQAAISGVTDFQIRFQEADIDSL